MTTQPDKLHYVRIPNGKGARAEMVRMTYVLAGRPYEDVLTSFADAAKAVGGKNPYKQFPFIETASGEIVYQTLAIMHHVAHGTSAWPSDPEALTRALMVAMGAYDLYQAFGGFTADDAVAKKKFEERRAPQYLGALGEIYAKTKFAAGDAPTFADCIAHEAVAWVVRRNDVCKALFEANKPLVDFVARFTALPAIHSFMERQAKARETDNTV
jgi:glutathione S-transferase